MQKYAEKRMQEEKELRDLVKQVAEGHKNPKAAKEKIQKIKQNIGPPYHLTLLMSQFLMILLEFWYISCTFLS